MQWPVRSASDGFVIVPALADAHAACAEVVEVGADDAAIEAGAAEPDAVGAGVGDLTILDGDVARPVGHDDGLDAVGGLMIAMAFPRQDVTGILEGEALERDVFDGLEAHETIRPPERPPAPCVMSSPGSGM